MTFPRSSGGVHEAIAFPFPGQPVDWAKPFTRPHAPRTSASGTIPIAAVTAAETSMPAETSFRGPRRSQSAPLTNCPMAYATRYAESIPASAVRVSPSCSSVFFATERFFRVR